MRTYITFYEKVSLLFLVLLFETNVNKVCGQTINESQRKEDETLKQTDKSEQLQTKQNSLDKHEHCLLAARTFVNNITILAHCNYNMKTNNEHTIVL